VLSIQKIQARHVKHGERQNEEQSATVSYLLKMKNKIHQR